METNFVILPSIEEEDMSLRESDTPILDAAQRYLKVQEKQTELAEKAEDRHISGSPGTIYLKRLGHRPLTAEDLERIVNAVGSDEDKKAVADFAAVQPLFNDRIADTRAIGLVLEQAEITRDLIYKRRKRPDLWKPEEVIKIMDILDRIGV